MKGDDFWDGGHLTDDFNEKANPPPEESQDKMAQTPGNGDDALGRGGDEFWDGGHLTEEFNEAANSPPETAQEEGDESQEHGDDFDELDLADGPPPPTFGQGDGSSSSSDQEQSDWEPDAAEQQEALDQRFDEIQDEMEEDTSDHDLDPGNDFSDDGMDGPGGP